MRVLAFAEGAGQPLESFERRGDMIRLPLMDSRHGVPVEDTGCWEHAAEAGDQGAG